MNKLKISQINFSEPLPHATARTVFVRNAGKRLFRHQSRCNQVRNQGLINAMQITVDEYDVQSENSTPKRSDSYTRSAITG